MAGGLGGDSRLPKESRKKILQEAAARGVAAPSADDRGPRCGPQAWWVGDAWAAAAAPAAVSEVVSGTQHVHTGVQVKIRLSVRSQVFASHGTARVVGACRWWCLPPPVHATAAASLCIAWRGLGVI